MKEKVDRKLILKLVERVLVKEFFGWGKKEEPKEETPAKLNIEPADLKRFIALLNNALETAREIRVIYPDKHHAKGKRKFLGVERLLLKLIPAMEKASSQPLQEASFGDPLPSDEELDAIISQYSEPRPNSSLPGEDEVIPIDDPPSSEEGPAADIEVDDSDIVSIEDDARAQAQELTNIGQQDLKLMSDLLNTLSTAAIIGNEIGKNKGFEGVPKNFTYLKKFIINAARALQNSLIELSVGIETDKEEELSKVPDWLVGNQYSESRSRIHKLIMEELDATLFGDDAVHRTEVHFNNKLGDNINLEINGKQINDSSVLLRPGKYRLTVDGPVHLDPKKWHESQEKSALKRLSEATIEIKGGKGVENTQEFTIHYEFQPSSDRSTGFQAVIAARSME